jgi:hypothetical protein
MSEMISDSHPTGGGPIGTLSELINGTDAGGVMGCCVRAEVGDEAITFAVFVIGVGTV